MRILLFVLFGFLFGSPVSTPAPGSSCKSQIDSVTKKLVYTEVDVDPVNADGPAQLQRKIIKALHVENAAADDLAEGITVAFIVDKDGSIKGERVIKDLTHQLGKEILGVVKSVKWTPGKCNGKPVAVLVKFPMCIRVTNGDE